MKKVISTIILVTLILSCVLALTACNPQNEIVGTWKQVGYDLSVGGAHHSNVDCFYDNARITFKQDNTGIDDDNDAFIWKYDTKTKKWAIAVDSEEYARNKVDQCYIDDNGILHIAYKTFEKVQ